MGTLFSTLDIMRSGLQAAQVQIETSGHNIANVNKEGFSRQRVELMTRSPIKKPYGALGRGVTIGGIRRLRDEFLDFAYRLQAPGMGKADIMGQYYTRLEDVFLEPREDGFGSRINLFFNALNDFSNNVEELPVRQAVLSEADSLATSMREMVRRFDVLRTDANEEIKHVTEEINSLAERIAYLNAQIRDTEVGGYISANDMRDDRGLLLDQLSELVNINYRERTDGQVDVLVGPDMLVGGESFRALEAVRDATLDPERNDLVRVQFADNGVVLAISNGQLQGAMTIRDEVVPYFDQRLDDLAATVIGKLNEINANGRGLSALSGVIEGTQSVDDPHVALGTAGLHFPVEAGSFDIVVHDAAGTPTTLSIAVDPATTTLAGLAADINAAAAGAGTSLTASVTADNQLAFTVAGDDSFRFANDTSGALAALGVNAFFTGHDARTIALNPVLESNPQWLSSGYAADLLETGDNQAALDMADLRNVALLDSGASTINDYYEATVMALGVQTRTNLQVMEVERAFVNTFAGRREEVSGVSIDEEVTFMLQYQRAYEACARVITVTDRMLDALLGMAR